MLPTFPPIPQFLPGTSVYIGSPHAIAVQQDSKILVAVEVTRCGNATLPRDIGCLPGYAAVVRYNADGSLDSAFGANGVATGPITTGANLVALLLQNDGKIVFGIPNRVLRLNTDGSPDLTFGNQGTVTIPVVSPPGQVLTYPNAITQQSDGKLLVASIGSLAGAASAVVRLNVDGSMDATYGDAGLARLAFGTSPRPPAMTVQPDGKLIVAAIAQQLFGSSTSSFVQRFNPDGSTDATFGQNGVASIAFTDTPQQLIPTSIALSVSVLANGKLLITAMQNAPTDRVGQLAVLQLNSNGTLDSSFGTTGRTVFAAPASLGSASAVRQSDGKIIFAGRTPSFVLDLTGPPSTFLTRLNPDGSADPQFGSCGTKQTSTYVSALPPPVALQPDGKVLFADFAAIPSVLGTNFQLALLRFQGGESTAAYVSSGTNPAPLGTPVSLDAQVLAVTPPATGTVTFYDDATPIQGCVGLPLVATAGQVGMGSSSFGASCQAQNLTGGTHTLSVTFNGDPVNPATTSCSVTQFVDPPGQLTAVEYYHDVFDNYFVTSLADEVRALDQHRFQGWRRTDLHFAVHPLDQLAGSAPVCRFFSGQSFAPKSSHFFTPLTSECAAVLQEPQWLFEGLVFGLTLPDGQGNCGPDTEPLYRLYNNGQGGAPNHRFLTDKGLRDRMAKFFGWVPEGFGIGVIGCVQ